MDYLCILYEFLASMERNPNIELRIQNIFPISRAPTIYEYEAQSP